jgi:beta-lactamase superfamily II metal-dependent hydrolase
VNRSKFTQKSWGLLVLEDFMVTSVRFVGYPSAVLVDDDNKPVIQRLWGSYLQLTGKKEAGFLQVKMGKDLLWIDENDTQSDGLLEIVFVDIGQGDGCLLSIPQPGKFPRNLVVDAGASDNMVRFLRDKFTRSGGIANFEAFVITHPDQDHYYGFDPIFDEPKFTVDTVYHSGLVERKTSAASDVLGAKAKVGNKSYMTELIATQLDLDNLLTPANIDRKQYPQMLRKAIDSGRVGNIRMLNADDKYVPGCGPTDSVTIQVLGPVPESVSGSPALRWFGDVGKTKNGHSIVLRLTYGKVSVLLGGDLNIPAEEYLLEHYTGETMPPRTAQDEERLVKKARRDFESDFAKSCHHGSADFTEYFLQAINAHATVISSGDDEPHAHPRADTLGTVGKHSRGRRSSIFSTELARSAPEQIKDADAFKNEIRTKVKELEAAKQSGTPAKIAKAQKAFDDILEKIKRSVTTFGAINMRTDGDKVVFAYRIERPGKLDKLWDIYKFERDGSGELTFQSKH